MVETGERAGSGETPRLERFEPSIRLANEAILRDKIFVMLYYAVDILGGNAGLIALWCEKEKLFVEEVSYGLDSYDKDSLRPLLQKAIPDFACSRQNFGQLSQLVPGAQEMAAIQRHNPIIAAPLEIDQKMIGLILVFRPYLAEPFKASDQRLLSSFALLVSASIQNTVLRHEVAEKQFKIEAVLAMSGDGIMTIDPERRIIGFNASMEKLTGWKKTEAVGRHCYDVLRISDDKGVNLCQTICPIAKGTERFSSFNSIITSKDGQKVDVTMSYSLARSPTGKLGAAVLNVRDISRALRTEGLGSMLLQQTAV